MSPFVQQRRQKTFAKGRRGQEMTVHEGLASVFSVEWVRIPGEVSSTGGCLVDFYAFPIPSLFLAGTLLG